MWYYQTNYLNQKYKLKGKLRYLSCVTNATQACQAYFLQGLQTSLWEAVLRIRIRMFLGLLDPDPDVRGMDPDLVLDPDPYTTKQKY